MERHTENLFMSLNHSTAGSGGHQYTPMEIAEVDGSLNHSTAGSGGHKGYQIY